MRVRLIDIARDLNLSSVTISKALRDHPDISQKTKKRVQKRIKELNYQPDLRARALAWLSPSSSMASSPRSPRPPPGQPAKKSTAS
jgi:hypothetical protein